MTFDLLQKILKYYNIPENVKMKSDSGWEANPIDMDGIWYNFQQNTIVFTRHGDVRDNYGHIDGWRCLYGTIENKEK